LWACYEGLVSLRPSTRGGTRSERDDDVLLTRVSTDTRLMANTGLTG
jgi:hypothetical protein